MIQQGPFNIVKLLIIEILQLRAAIHHLPQT